MFDAIRAHVLRLLRVPAEPEPPAGGPGTLRVFRAAPNYYKIRLLRWGIAQLGAIVGLTVSFVMLDRFASGFEHLRTPPPPTPASAPAATGEVTREGTSGNASPEKSARRARSDRGRTALKKMADRLPAWLFVLVSFAEFGAIALFLLQLPFTYALARLEYELRWYMVTDRSLRIRSGLTTVQEITMSFANLQQVVVTQGPLQRLLGLADLRVQSAGGGAGESHGTGESLHTGFFHGVENAHEIRDLILDRLRRFRETGLGDPDEPSATGPADPPATGAVLAAARSVLEETRALRRQLG